MKIIETLTMVSKVKIDRIILNLVKKIKPKKTRYQVQNIPENIRKFKDSKKSELPPGKFQYIIRLSLCGGLFSNHVAGQNTSNEIHGATNTGSYITPSLAIPRSGSHIAHYSSVSHTPYIMGENEIDLLMDYYPCIIDNNGNEIESLDFFTDGYVYNFENKNSNKLMIKFPNCGYRIYNFKEHLDGQRTVDIGITNMENLEGYKYITYKGQKVKAFYVGLSDGSTKTVNGTTVLCSEFDATVNNSLTLDQARTYAHNNGNNFEILNYDILTYLQCCLLVKYCGVVSYFHNLSYSMDNTLPILKTGVNRYGYNSGCDDTSVSPICSTWRIFGLENLWGGNSEKLIDGIKIKNENNQIKILLNKNNNNFSNINNYTEVYSKNLNDIYSNNVNYLRHDIETYSKLYLETLEATNTFCPCFSEGSDVDSIGFISNTNIYNSGNILFGGPSLDYDDRQCGPFAYKSSSDAKGSARLVYFKL